MKAPTSIVRPVTNKENTYDLEPEALPPWPARRLRPGRRRGPGLRAGCGCRQEEADDPAAEEGRKAEEQYGEGHDVELSADAGPRQRLLSARPIGRPSSTSDVCADARAMTSWRALCFSAPSPSGSRRNSPYRRSQSARP